MVVDKLARRDDECKMKVECNGRTIILSACSNLDYQH